jgi:hypothetical protein
VDGQLLALSPQAAEARAAFGDWIREPECPHAEESQGPSPYGDPHHHVGEIGGDALLRDNRDNRAGLCWPA